MDTLSNYDPSETLLPEIGGKIQAVSGGGILDELGDISFLNSIEGIDVSSKIKDLLKSSKCTNDTSISSMYECEPMRSLISALAVQLLNSISDTTIPGIPVAAPVIIHIVESDTSGTSVGTSNASGASDASGASVVVHIVESDVSGTSGTSVVVHIVESDAPVVVPNTPVIAPVAVLNAPVVVPNTPVPNTPVVVPNAPVVVPNAPVITPVPNTPVVVPVVVPNVPVVVPNVPVVIPNAHVIAPVAVPNAHVVVHIVKPIVAPVVAPVVVPNAPVASNAHIIINTTPDIVSTILPVNISDNRLTSSQTEEQLRVILPDNSTHWMNANQNISSYKYKLANNKISENSQKGSEMLNTKKTHSRKNKLKFDMQNENNTININRRKRIISPKIKKEFASETRSDNHLVHTNPRTKTKSTRNTLKRQAWK